MLQEHSGGEGVDISLAPSCRSADGLHGSQGDRGGESLIDIPHRESRSFRELGTHDPDLGGTRRLTAVGIEGESEHETRGAELRGAPDEGRDGRAFPGPANEVAGRSRDRAGWVADREPDPPVAVVDTEEPRTKGDIRGPVAGHPSAMLTKNSLLVFVRIMRSSRK
jgi:hypothetical protein